MLEKKNLLGYAVSLSGRITGGMRICGGHHIIFIIQKHRERFAEQQPRAAISSSFSNCDPSTSNSQPESDACTDAGTSHLRFQYQYPTPGLKLRNLQPGDDPGPCKERDAGSSLWTGACFRRGPATHPATLPIDQSRTCRLWAPSFRLEQHPGLRCASA